MMNPLLFVGLVLAKKALAVALYTAGRRYGWPRVYRRLLEANSRVTPRDRQPVVRRVVAHALRMPSATAAAARDSDVYRVAVASIEELQRKGGAAGSVVASLLNTALTRGAWEEKAPGGWWKKRET